MYQRTDGPLTKRHSNEEYFEYNDQSAHNIEDGEQWSCDESVLEKQIRMPNVLGNKIELQEDIGLQISKNTEHYFHDELNRSDLKPSDNFFRIIQKDPIDVINDYHDRCPCLRLRKRIMRARIYINRLAILIITNKIFETVSIMVIIANSLFLAMDDPITTVQPVY